VWEIGSKELLRRAVELVSVLGLNLKSLGEAMDDVGATVDNGQALPDDKKNPRIASRDEIYTLLVKSNDHV
jgi:hypothetical protein